MTAIEQTTAIPAVAASQRSPNRAWRKLKANKGALVGLVIIVFFTALAILAPVLPIPDPVATTAASPGRQAVPRDGRRSAAR